MKGLFSACLSSNFFCLFQSYIHGSSQAQFVAESHIILLLNILSHKASLCTMDLSHCLVNEVNRNNPLTSYRSVHHSGNVLKCLYISTAFSSSQGLFSCFCGVFFSVIKYDLKSFNVNLVSAVAAKIF